MTRKDKRSLTLMLLLGDGNLHVMRSKYGLLTIDHGIEQSDYQAWKARLLSDIWNKNVKCRPGHKGKSVQVQIYHRRFKAWKKFTCPNNKKNLGKILPFILHKELALAVWLMDDGYVEASFTKNKNYSAAFRIFTCDQDNETQDKIIQWLKNNFNVDAKIRYTLKRSTNKKYPFIKINHADSIKIWEHIRKFVLQFKSMQYKFRHMESIYQKRLSQRTTKPQGFDDIVDTLGN
jgi:hypothetical protein